MITGGQTSLPSTRACPRGGSIRVHPEDVAESSASAFRRSTSSPPSPTTSCRCRPAARRSTGPSTGHDPEFALMRTQIAQLGGRFIDADDEAEGRKVAFIGWHVARDLFGSEDPVGKTIVINRIPFTVVGVLQKKLQDSMYQGPDAEQVYLPFRAFRQIDNQRYLDRSTSSPGAAGNRGSSSPGSGRSSAGSTGSTRRTATPSTSGTPSRTPRRAWPSSGASRSSWGSSAS